MPPGDLTPEHKELHNRAEVKSFKGTPATLLRDSPAARKFEEVFEPYLISSLACN